LHFPSVDRLDDLVFASHEAVEQRLGLNVEEASFLLHKAEELRLGVPHEKLKRITVGAASQAELRIAAAVDFDFLPLC